MKNSIEVSARTIEDAVNEGLSKLGCSISDCKVDILQEGAKGLFGFFGSKPATVRLTLLDEESADDLGIDLHSALNKAPEAPSKAARPQQQPRERAPQKQQERKPVTERKPVPEKNGEKGKMRIAANPQIVDKPKNSDVLERFKSAPLPGGRAPVESQPQKQAPKPVRPPRPPKPRAPRVPREEHQDDRRESMHADSIERTPVPAPENIVMHDPETPEGRAQQFLLEMTRRMGVDVQIETSRGDDGHLFATMYGDTLGILIGRRGETLDALQYLTSLQVNRGREEYTRVTLDTENYRAKREEALTRLAARMANRAVKTGRKVSQEPMNPYERRILHASLQGNPSVTTHSEGDEPYRHVVVVPER